MSNINLTINVDTSAAEAGIARVQEQLRGLASVAASIQGSAMFQEAQKEMQRMSTNVQSMERQLRQVAQTTQEINKTSKEGFGGVRTEIEKTQKSVVGLGWSMRDIAKDALSLANFQARWYLSRQAIFAVPGAIGAGASFEAEIDKAQATLLRYSAMEGQVTDIHRRTAEEITTYSRQLAVNLPLDFGEIIKSADRLLAAGADINTVKGSLESFAKLQVAFPEIQMEKFTNATIGFLNTFRKTPGLAGFENDAQRLQAILDKTTVALAKGVIAPQDINVVIQHLGQMSQAAGFSIDQMLALSVMVTNLGSKAGPAGRALRGLIDSLATTKGIENLEKIGVHLDRQKTIAAQFKTIIEGLRKAVGTGEAGLSLGSMEFLRGIAPTERRSALIALIRELETYDELVISISQSQGALDRTAAVMTDTLSGQWQIFKNISREMGKALTNSDLLRDSLAFLIDTLKVFGFMLSGIVGVTSMAVDGFKFLYQTLRLIANPLERVIMSVARLLTGDYKGALAEIKSMPQVFDERLFKANDALSGSLDRAAKEVVTIQNVLFGKDKMTGGKGEIKGGGMAGVGVPLPEDKAYKNMVQDLNNYRQHLQHIYNIEKQIQELALTYTLKTSHAEREKQAALVDYQYKTLTLSIEEFYKQKDILRQQDLADEASSIQETTRMLTAELDKQITNIRESMKKMKGEDVVKANRQIIELEKKQELLTAQETAKISEITRKGEIESAKELRQLAYEKWQAEKGYKEQFVSLTHDATSNELTGIQRTADEARKKYESLIPLIDRVSEAQKNLWKLGAETDILKSQKGIADIKGEHRTSLSYQVELYGKDLDRLAQQIKQRENDLSLAQITGKDVELVSLDLNRLMMKYAETMEQIKAAQQKLTGSPMEGLVSGLEKYTSQAKTIFEQMEEAGLKAAQGMENAFTNFIDYASDDFMNFGNLAKGILHELYIKTIQSTMISPLVSGITTSIAGLFKHQGGLIMHSGGIVPDYSMVPRFHGGGLNYDERPAILQTGEYVVSRRGVAALDSINGGRGIQFSPDMKIEIVNQTSQPISAKTGDIKFNGREYVIGIMLEDLQKGGPYSSQLAHMR